MIRWPSVTGMPVVSVSSTTDRMAIRVQLSTVWYISRGGILTRQPESALLVAAHFIHTAVGQLVGPLVAGMADVPAHPFPGDVVAVALLIEQLPQVGAFHRLLGGGFPAALLPVDHPLVDALHHVLGVGYQQHVATTLELFKATDRAHQLHAVVSGVGFAAPQFLLHAFAHQQSAPSAGARVALAGAIGEEFYAIGHRLHPSKRAGDHRPTVSRGRKIRRVIKKRFTVRFACD